MQSCISLSRLANINLSSPAHFYCIVCTRLAKSCDNTILYLGKFYKRICSELYYLWNSQIGICTLKRKKKILEQKEEKGMLTLNGLYIITVLALFKLLENGEIK